MFFIRGLNVSETGLLWSGEISDPSAFSFAADLSLPRLRALIPRDAFVSTGIVAPRAPVAAIIRTRGVPQSRTAAIEGVVILVVDFESFGRWKNNIMKFDRTSVAPPLRIERTIVPGHGRPVISREGGCVICIDQSEQTTADGRYAIDGPITMMAARVGRVYLPLGTGFLVYRICGVCAGTLAPTVSVILLEAEAA